MESNHDTEPTSREAAPASMPGPADLVAEIGRVFIGQETVVTQVVTSLVAGGHVLLEGLPGLGKTLLCRTLAATFDGKFARIQFTPDLMPADITGHTIYNPAKGAFLMRRGPIFTHLLLADEINRAPAKTQAALLEAMQEYQVTLDGRSLALDRPFMTIATQNPIELEGTYPLPEAQLDRFLMKVLVPYPEETAEKRLVTQVVAGRASDALDVSGVRPIISIEQVSAMQAEAAAISVDSALVDYAVDIVRQSRETPGIAAGGSPRAALALVRCARATALIDGRDFVIPDDIKANALAVLRHRLSLTPEYEIEGWNTDQLIEQLLTKVAAPRT